MRIMFLGDSLTEGFLVPGGFRWKVLDAFPHATSVGSLTDSRGLQHEGHTGCCIEHIEEGLNNWLDSTRPDTVVFLAGSNNLGTETPEYIVEHIANVVQRLKSAGVSRIYVLTLPWAKGLDIPISQINALLRRNVELWGDNVVLVDTGNALQPFAMFTDECHPNEIGHTVMAEKITEAMKGVAPMDRPAPRYFAPTPFVSAAGVSTGAVGVPTFLASDSFGSSDEFRGMLVRAMPGLNFVGINERYPDYSIDQISSRLSGAGGALQKYNPIKLIVFAGLDELSTKKVPPLRITQELGALSNNAQGTIPLTLQVYVVELPKILGLEAMVRDTNSLLRERMPLWVKGGSVYQPPAQLVPLNLYNEGYDADRTVVLSVANTPTWTGNALVARSIVKSLGGDPGLVPLVPPTPPPKLPIPVVAPPVGPPKKPPQPAKSTGSSGGALLAVAALGVGAAVLLSKKG